MNERNRNRLEYAACLMVLVLLPLTIIGVWAFTDSLPGVAGRPYSISHHVPESYANDENDLFRSLYAHYAWIHTNAVEGDSLLWNPDEGCGIPFFALVRNQIFSPFTVPVYFFESLTTALCWSIYLKLLVAGCCAFYMARRFGLHLPLALFFSVSYQLSMVLVNGAATPFADTFVWFPLVLVLAEQFLHGNIRPWPLGAFLFLLMLAGGAVEGVLFTYCYLLLYICMRALRAKQWFFWLKATTASVLAILFSIGLFSIVLLPWQEYLDQSEDIAHYIDQLSLFGLHAGYDSTVSIPFIALYWHAHPGYTGLLSMMLLALWFSIRRFTAQPIRRRVEALIMTAILMLVLNPFYTFLLPGSVNLMPMYSIVVFPGLIIALLYTSSRAAEEWNALESEACKRALKRLPVAALVWWGLLIGIAIKFCIAGALSKHPFLDLGLLIIYVVVLSVLFYRTLFTPSIRVMGYTLVLLLFIPLWLYHIVLFPVPRMNLALEQDRLDAVALMQDAEDRMAGPRVIEHFPAYPAALRSFRSSPDLGLHRYKAFSKSLNEDPLLLRRANVSNLLLEKEDIAGPYADIRPDLRIEKIFDYGLIYFKDLKAEPRARMIYAGRKRTEETPLSSDLPPLLEGGTLPEADDGPVAKVTITEESNTEVKIQIEETRAGVLVLADTFYPGWHALVDGKPAAIFPVDILFRGVEVGEGAHEVIFYYDPFSLKLGKIISAIALLICLFSLRHLIRWKKKHPLDMRTL